MKVKEIFSQEINDLKKLLKKKELELKGARLALISKKNKDVKKINKIKKDIARVLTILSDKIRKNKQIES